MALDRKRLRAFLAVALSSEEPGEVAAALKKTRKLLKDAKLDIHWLLSVIETAEPPLSSMPWWPPPPSQDTSWQTMLEYCHRDDRLPAVRRSNEREFIVSLWRQSADHPKWRPTDKQLNWLRAIYFRLQAVA